MIRTESAATTMRRVVLRIARVRAHLRCCPPACQPRCRRSSFCRPTIDHHYACQQHQYYVALYLWSEPRVRRRRCGGWCCGLLGWWPTYGAARLRVNLAAAARRFAVPSNHRQRYCFIIIHSLILQFHLLTTADIFATHCKSGAPIIYIRHMDDWLEQGAAEEAGVFNFGSYLGESGFLLWGESYVGVGVLVH